MVSGVAANNEVTVPVGSGGQVSVYNSGGTTNITIDVLGYYSTNGSGMHAINPARAADTRTGSGQPYAGQPIPANGSLTVQVSGIPAVPTTAATAILQVTAVNPTANGYLITYPAGTTRPNASNLNYKSGATLTKEVTATLGSNPAGAVTFYNSSSTALNVIVDVTGYVGGVGDTFTPLSPPEPSPDRRYPKRLRPALRWTDPPQQYSVDSSGDRPRRCTRLRAVDRPQRHRAGK
ncbi:hypothetical protein [Lapillicoccus sp.]|uniref:hypothetical protein n=1 Tax=Lapillicoccus sp. TaxID=1909287 RepID=UPI0025FD36CE|nr:hypothetical protein [Lapillicoccus sp.]